MEWGISSSVLNHCHKRKNHGYKMTISWYMLTKHHKVCWVQVLITGIELEKVVIKRWRRRWKDIMSSAKQGNRSCPECRRGFPSNKALYGHMRCHPGRSYRGINAPTFSMGKCNSGDRSDNSVVASEMEAVVGLLLLGKWTDHMSSEKKKVATEKKKTKGGKLNMIIMDEEVARVGGGESSHRKSTTRSSSPAKTTKVMDFDLNEMPTM